MAKRSNSRASTRKSPAVNPDVRLFRLPGIPEIRGGDDLCQQITSAARKARTHYENGDVLVLAQKIGPKAGRAVANLETIQPSPQARAIAERQNKDARLVE